MERMRVTWYPIARLLVCTVGGVEVAKAACKDAGQMAQKIAAEWQDALGYLWYGTIDLA